MPVLGIAEETDAFGAVTGPQQRRPGTETRIEAILEGLESTAPQGAWVRELRSQQRWISSAQGIEQIGEPAQPRPPVLHAALLVGQPAGESEDLDEPGVRERLDQRSPAPVPGIAEPMGRQGRGQLLATDPSVPPDQERAIGRMGPGPSGAVGPHHFAIARPHAGRGRHPEGEVGGDDGRSLQMGQDPLHDLGVGAQLGLVEDRPGGIEDADRRRVAIGPGGIESEAAQHPSMVRAFLGPVPSRAVPIDIDIAKVARLARMGLDDAELERIGAQLGDILEHAARIQALDLEDVPPTAHPLPMVNAFRTDEAGPTLDRDEVLDQAPLRDGPFFRVPPFMDEA